MEQGFAIWLTGKPASGKSTVATELAERLSQEDILVQVLESDELRKILTPKPTYTLEERDWFYDVMVYLGKMLTDQGINVIFDATGNKRKYRQDAREIIEHFAEVYVKCPSEVCIERDPKGIYKRAREGKAPTVPGLGSSYEEPTDPEMSVDGTSESPEQAVEKIFSYINSHWL